MGYSPVVFIYTIFYVTSHNLFILIMLKVFFCFILFQDETNNKKTHAKIIGSLINL